MKEKDNLKISCRKASFKDFEGICQIRSQLASDPKDRLTTEYAPYNPEIDIPWVQENLKLDFPYTIVDIGYKPWDK